MNVVLLSTALVQTQISQKLLNRLSWHFVLKVKKNAIYGHFHTSKSKVQTKASCFCYTVCICSDEFWFHIAILQAHVVIIYMCGIFVRRVWHWHAVSLVGSILWLILSGKLCIIICYASYFIVRCLAFGLDWTLLPFWFWKANIYFDYVCSVDKEKGLNEWMN